MATKRSIADRDAELEALTQQIVDGVRQVTVDDAGAWLKFLDFAKGFHTYSFRNQMLIYLQNPDATLVAGYRDWQTRGRQVTKGEKGLRIFAPVTKRLPFDRDGNPIPKENLPNYAKTDVRWQRRMVGVRPTSTFDVSQTEGDPVPQAPRPTLLTGEAPAHLWDRLASIATDNGFRLERRDLAAEGNQANGYTDFTAKEIVVRTGVSDAQAVKTLAHEIGHMLLHHDVEPADLLAHRGTYEVEAESVAYMVSSQHGLDTSDYTFRYISVWSRLDPEKVLASADRIMRASRHVLDRTLDEQIDTVENKERSAEILQRAQQQEAEAQRLNERAPTPPTQQPTITAQRHAQIHAAAQEHYQATMRSEAGTGPRTYLEGRKLGALLTGTAIAGYAAGQWTGLVDDLHARGFTDDEIMAAGLGVHTRRDTVVDRFRERITLPIHDDEGTIIGFVGRAPDHRDERAPKYLNTPAVEHFNKSETVYGLHHATTRDDLTRIVVTEGPFDAESINAAARAQNRDDVLAVATAGTALTPIHAAKIAAIAEANDADIVLSFDPDDAGINATHRAVDLLPHDRLRIAPAVGGHDPAEIHQTLGAGPLIATVDVARPHYQWELDQHLAHAPNTDTVSGKVRAIADAEPIITQAPEDEQWSLWEHTAHELDVPPVDVATQIYGTEADPPEPASATPQAEPATEATREYAVPTKPAAAPTVSLPEGTTTDAERADITTALSSHSADTERSDDLRDRVDAIRQDINRRDLDAEESSPLLSREAATDHPPVIQVDHEQQLTR